MVMLSQFRVDIIEPIARPAIVQEIVMFTQRGQTPFLGQDEVIAFCALDPWPSFHAQRRWDMRTQLTLTMLDS